MKRHPSLHPLSRDHHHALVQARSLIMAARSNDPRELEQAAAHFAGFWESDLLAHFYQEEQFVLPLLAKHAPPGGNEVRETLRQHAEIAQMVAKLSDRLSRQQAVEAGLLDALGELLRLHIRFEENELFPAVETSATDAELRRMYEQIEAEKARAGHGGCALSPKSQATEKR